MKQTNKIPFLIPIGLLLLSGSFFINNFITGAHFLNGFIMGLGVTLIIGGFLKQRRYKRL